MEPMWQGILFLIAVVCFVLAMIWPDFTRPNLVAAGLAFATFVFMYNAFAAA